MLPTRILATTAAALVLAASTAAMAASFNGAADNTTDAYGYYYIITGGKFPTGTTPNGDNASGGTFRFLTDDPTSGYPIDTWQKDDWFPDNAGFALTMRNGAATVYDNNGIEDGTYGDYYDQSGSHGAHGLYRGYSMSNVWDWIYAGYFKLDQTTTFDTLIGYFDANGGSADPFPFDPFNSNIRYHMNIFSNVSGDLLPTNTGSFAGDVLTSDLAAGTFSVSDTGVLRQFTDGTTDPIYRLQYTLNAPVTLGPGTYWFSHDASVVPVPAAVWAGCLLLSGLGTKRMLRRRR